MLNSDIDIKKCYGLLQKYNIWSDDYNILRKNFKLFALKNHPDKSGVKEVFQSVSSCKDILDDDFNYFKDIANKSDVYDYNEEKVTYDYDYDFDDSSDEDFNPTIKPKAKSNSKAKVPKYTYIDFETFVKKECTGGRGGWLSEELRNFCTILGLNNKGKKEELCKRLSTYFASINPINPDTVKQKESNGVTTVTDMKDILEKVYKEQQRIREEEINNLNEKMSNLSINV
jgi:hypothetical protein